MPRVPTDRVKRSFDELSKFLSRQDVFDALEKVGKNPALLRKAKADPQTFFRGENIKLLPRIQLTLSRRAVAGPGQPVICVRAFSRSDSSPAAG